MFYYYLKAGCTLYLINQIHKRYLYICKSFLAHDIFSTIRQILHTVLISTKCLIEIMIII